MRTRVTGAQEGQSVVTDLKGDVGRIGGDEVEKVFVLDERALLHDLYILRNKVQNKKQRLA